MMIKQRHKIIFIFGFLSVCAGLLFIFNKNTEGSADQSSIAKTDSSLKSQGKQNDAVKSSKPFVASASGAKKVSFGSDTELQNLFKELNPDVDWKMNKDSSGLLTMISGGVIAPDQQQKIIENLSSYLGINPSDLSVSDQRHNESTYSYSESYEQRYKNYEVLQASIRVYKRADDNSIFMVSNEARRIESADLSMKLNLENAVSQISDNGASVRPVRETPVLFVDQQNHGQLVWMLSKSESGSEVKSYLVLVSASTGKPVLVSPEFVKN